MSLPTSSLFRERERGLPPRVNQLDAERLHEEILDLLKQEVSGVFAYLPFGWLQKWSPEIDLFLRLLLWKYTVWRSAPSPADSVQNLTFDLERSCFIGSVGPSERSGRKRLPLNIRLLYALLHILLPWLLARLKQHLQNAEDPFPSSRHHQMRRPGLVTLRQVETAERVVEALSLVNLVAFLLQGRYRSLSSRLLGLQMREANPDVQRQISFEYMQRHLYWHSFTELLMILLPLVNLRALRLMAWRWASRASAKVREEIVRWQERVATLSGAQTSLKNGSGGAGLEGVEHGGSKGSAEGKWRGGGETINSRCPLCSDAVMTSEIEASCGHRFCYFCLSSACAADRDFACPLCAECVDWYRWPRRRRAPPLL
uniref:RING-type E3 ubiquitin transferase (cysteine targeting) n=1 Tax=Chromera velia CCMP2878 TaxID=1169474 RepID=A0A0G4GN12_9ALVE|eukprot:Cvel_22624.t1-p1 / transcript=Cvel_22624.t1 / gene=Cvel_22624 / organism=Chromera_velia_CCMP2878 / gene_product=Peroxisome biogenesis protein 2, putative / transcript_product=Peroxisome biogenesis protein 2, putative / location=Cvel_scaffold2241:26022-27131(-) / protein_length=370 / sequence_SO=supercontig / SO=protein_coding / is_pseudo=false